MTSATMTVRLDNKLKIRLEKLAEATHRSKSFLAVEAISDYVKLHEWQISEIKKAIREANSGELIDHNMVVRYWENKRANSMDKKS